MYRKNIKIVFYINIDNLNNVKHQKIVTIDFNSFLNNTSISFGVIWGSSWTFERNKKKNSSYDSNTNLLRGYNGNAC
jgi:hypothetical protein